MESVQASENAAAAVAVNQDTRVKLADIEAFIVAEYTTTADKAFSGAPIHDSLPLLSLHVMVMKNGFVLVGKSAPADPANFNAELGAKLAREDCIRQLWPLMGFALRNKLNGL